MTASSRPFASRPCATTSAASSITDREVELDVLEVDLSGLDLGEVQDVVDHCQERAPPIADGLGILQLLIGQLRS